MINNIRQGKTAMRESQTQKFYTKVTGNAVTTAWTTRPQRPMSSRAENTQEKEENQPTESWNLFEWAN